eukprot:3863477-Rhodomonas_salina.1
MADLGREGGSVAGEERQRRERGEEREEREETKCTRTALAVPSGLTTRDSHVAEFESEKFQAPAAPRPQNQECVFLSLISGRKASRTLERAAHSGLCSATDRDQQTLTGFPGPSHSVAEARWNAVSRHCIIKDKTPQKVMFQEAGNWRIVTSKTEICDEDEPHAPPGPSCIRQ